MIKEEAFLKKNHPVMWLASKYHKTHKNQMLSFKDRPFLVPIYLDNEEKDIMKSTQCGLSEYLIVLVISLAMQGKNIFHVLPTLDLVGRFVANRLNKSIEFSEFYTNLIKEGNSDRMTLKQIGNGSVAFVGSNTPKAFVEFPADVVIADEEDQCNPANLAMAWERMSESEDRREFNISNPTLLKYGIHKRWLKSDQRLWNIKADCGHYVNPDFFKHVVRQVDEDQYALLDTDYEWGMNRDIHLICDKCGKPVDRRGQGIWVPSVKGNKHGYQISKLFSTNVKLVEIVERFNEGLLNEEIMQRVYNADFGKPYNAKGSKLTDEMLDKCCSDEIMRYRGGACIAGIDVGSMIHIKISEIRDNKLHAVYIGSVRDELAVDALFAKYQIVSAVMDANPETRMAERLCSKHKGLFRCYYGEVKTDGINLDDKILTVRRTSALDNVMESIITQTIILPVNASELPEFYDHMKASNRILDMKANKGKGDYKWVETGPDHLFHASAYELIARNLLVMLAGA